MDFTEILLIENVTTVTVTKRRLLDPTHEASGNGGLLGPSPLCNGFYEESPAKTRALHYR
jgi:hypothetical protein